MLFYLGPELIAALLGACEGTRENSQASCGLSRPSVDERDVTPSPASPSSLPCAPTSIVAVSVTIHLFLYQVCSGVRIHETDAPS